MEGLKLLFEIPGEITDYLAELDDFIEREIKPIEARERQYPLLRSPPRARPDRLGQ